MGDMMILPPEQFWKIRSLTLELQIAYRQCQHLERAQAIMAQAKADADLALVEAGLNPAQRYRLNKHDLSATVDSGVDASDVG